MLINIPSVRKTEKKNAWLKLRVTPRLWKTTMFKMATAKVLNRIISAIL